MAIGRARIVIVLLAILAGVGQLAACGDNGTTPPIQPPLDTVPPDPPPPPPTHPPTGAIAFEGVTVVPMVEEGTLPNHTVVVRDGVIQEIAPSDQVAIPDSVTVIPGQGLFLTPGLADMHTHISVISSFAQVPDPLAAEQQGILLIANGVTTILNMGDYERHDLISLRNRWVQGEALGPTMFVGKFIRGQQDSGTSNEIATTGARARELVARAWSLDYDFIKIYSRVTNAVHTAAADEAERLGLPAFGHLPTGLSLQAALGNGQSMVAHAAEYFSRHYSGQIDPSQTPAAISVTNQHGAWVTSTLSASESFRAAWGNNRPEYNQLLARPGVRFTHPEIIGRWEWWLGQGSVPNQLDAQMPFIMEFTNDFKDGDIPILLGTDAPELPGLPSGFAVHTELELLIEAGFTPFEALSAGTAAPGRFAQEFFSEHSAFGTVEPGRRADLLLLRSDPLQSITALQDRVGVMVAGIWHPQDELDSQLEELAELYGN